MTSINKFHQGALNVLILLTIGQFRPSCRTIHRTAEYAWRYRPVRRSLQSLQPFHAPVQPGNALKE